MSSYCDEEGLAVQQVGELVESLSHCGFAGLGNIQLAGDHDIIGSIFRRQEKDTICVCLIVQKRDATLAQIICVVLHLDHQVCREAQIP